MAKEQTDDELNLRRKARRRLIGAVALTLAVVVILPMVLDSEPKSTGKDIDLRIPAPDKVGAFVPRVAVSEVAVTLPSAASVVVASSAPLAAPAIATPVQETEAAKPVVEASQQKQEVPSKAQAASHKPLESPKPAEAKQSAEIDKPTETSSENQPASAESFVAQVGAYSNQATAKQELKKLKKWGFRAYTEKVGDKTRVRVGPYPDRDKAEKAGHLLEKHGFHPVVMPVQ
jgi:DedD protein